MGVDGVLVFPSVKEDKLLFVFRIAQELVGDASGFGTGGRDHDTCCRKEFTVPALF